MITLVQVFAFFTNLFAPLARRRRSGLTNDFERTDCSDQVENPSATGLQHLVPLGGDPIDRKLPGPYARVLHHPAIEFRVFLRWMIWRMASSGDLISM